jgi:hypothetical protein
VTYLFVKLDFAVQVLLCERSKVLDFLRVVGLYLCHRCVQDGLASRGNFLVKLLRRERVCDPDGNDSSLAKKQTKKKDRRRAIDPSVASVYRDDAFRWVSMIGCAKRKQASSVRTPKSSYRI